ncbi:type I-E CRISPR-associated endoribonuclease Cas2e [Fibrisoma limi]|uniref:type I-E CRISPR-associated endoribonuclease Cas2e n=1 Tax=Fibrisoma limi TaxID=663275 RepID=UPI00058804D0|nr:type I-E CRISPR-associated endoribonuclease Cas2e [Fibrisoma limi]
MTVFILERVSPSLRGDLSRWLVEVQAGVFVGRINEVVRDALWERATDRADDGTVTMLWRMNNEQGFDLRTWQPKQYIPINIEGIWLTMRPLTHKS